MKNTVNICILLIIIFSSCNTHTKRDNPPIDISRYKIEITYSNFLFECGDYKKIIIDNYWSQDGTYKNLIKNYYLYTINMAGRCQNDFHTDTISKKISISQSDSIFLLANNYVNNIKISQSNLSKEREIITDASSLKVEVFNEDKSKSVTLFQLDESYSDKDLKRLIDYIDFILFSPQR